MPVTAERPARMTGGRVLLDEHVVLRDVDFEIAAGEFVVLLGPNGSGKTTLVRALLGVVPLAAGRVELFGRPLGRFGDWAQIGYVPQRLSAASGVPATVDEVVLSGRVARARPFKRFGEGDRRAAAAALETVGLRHLARRPVAALSGGEQQRALIARALTTEPDLLVLDEPVSGVDIEHQGSFATTLRRLKEEGRTVLVVAHSLGALEPLVGRAVVLRAGRVAYNGPPLAEHADEHGDLHHQGQAPAMELPHGAGRGMERGV